MDVTGTDLVLRVRLGYSQNDRGQGDVTLYVDDSTSSIQLLAITLDPLRFRDLLSGTSIAVAGSFVDPDFRSRVGLRLENGSWTAPETMPPLPYSWRRGDPVPAEVEEWAAALAAEQGWDVWSFERTTHHSPRPGSVRVVWRRWVDASEVTP